MSQAWATGRLPGGSEVAARECETSLVERRGPVCSQRRAGTFKRPEKENTVLAENHGGYHSKVQDRQCEECKGHPESLTSKQNNARSYLLLVHRGLGNEILQGGP